MKQTVNLKITSLKLSRAKVPTLGRWPCDILGLLGLLIVLFCRVFFSGSCRQANSCLQSLFSTTKVESTHRIKLLLSMDVPFFLAGGFWIICDNLCTYLNTETHERMLYYDKMAAEFSNLIGFVYFVQQSVLYIYSVSLNNNT